MKVGDKVVFKKEYMHMAPDGFQDAVHTIRYVDKSSIGDRLFLFDPEKGEPRTGATIKDSGKYYYWAARPHQLDLVDAVSRGEDVIKEVNEEKHMTKLMDKFRMTVTPEPKRSFIKAGILDMNNNLTDEGKELFLLFLLEKNKETFYSSVVHPILEADKD